MTRVTRSQTQHAHPFWDIIYYKYKWRDTYQNYQYDGNSTLNCNDIKLRCDIMDLNLKENEFENHKNQSQNT